MHAVRLVHLLNDNTCMRLGTKNPSLCHSTSHYAILPIPHPPLTSLPFNRVGTKSPPHHPWMSAQNGAPHLFFLFLHFFSSFFFWIGRLLAEDVFVGGDHESRSSWSQDVYFLALFPTRVPDGLRRLDVWRPWMPTPQKWKGGHFVPTPCSLTFTHTLSLSLCL